MYRFFSPFPSILNEEIIISHSAQIHHLRRVLRIKLNEKVALFDESGREYLCVVKDLSERQVRLIIKDKRIPVQKKTTLTIACAIPKKAKFDEIVDKLVQLGVDKIIPLMTERVVIKLDKEKKVARLERWKKICQSAAEQSQRATLPVIEPVQNMEEVLRQADIYDLKLIPTLEGKRKTLKEVFKERGAKNILVFIGPEGDFTDGEVDLAKKAGCIPVSLGDTVLRVDTAAIAVTSFIKLYENH